MNIRGTDEIQLKKLLALAEEAAFQTKGISKSYGELWEKRLEQFQLGVVDNLETKTWLENHANYYQEKDRHYAEFIARFARSYQPVIDV